MIRGGVLVPGTQVWPNSGGVRPKKFACGYCGLLVASERGYQHTNTNPEELIYICPHCDGPTFFCGSNQVPGVAFGGSVDHLPVEVSNVYAEARNCMTVSAFTGAVLLCRKLLMNVAVSQGAKQNQQFTVYVDYLAEKGYVPPNAKGWVDLIRQKGNEATHEIPIATETDAKDLITFMEMILKLIFEFPSKIPGHGSSATGTGK